MGNQNTSKKIRNYIRNQCSIIDETFWDVSDSEKAAIFFESMDNFESSSPIHILRGHDVPDVVDFKILRGITIFSRIQLYTDFYRSMKLQDKLFGTDRLESYPRVKSYDDIKKMSENDIVKYEMLDSLMEYNESSGFDKVLFSKCLDESDVKYLKSINMFFEEEYEKSNINVDLDFIVKHIEKWQKSFPMDINISYDQAAKFIFDLYKLKKEEAENFLVDLFREDLGIISSTKSENEDSIMMGQVCLNVDNLSIMLKDYYKYQKKVLNKKR